ncbi:uncharacterized protein LOC123518151 [Portunus trituberculatus]|uniref:uncharacterized protein LOC123518151 n=1 Tax=Portunus trituberculatus TaxID=210409 RepID=UPI001E1CBE22|nr:uncharacterized protein LOC123518151 [Portunus trituberculatus]XP_045134784.1 uncharacterized protein LOC123518151 [Portunus trituberculatus]
MHQVARQAVQAFTITFHTASSSSIKDLQTIPALKSNNTCASDSQFSYGGVNGIPKQRMYDDINDYSNGEDEFVQLCGINECLEKNVGCEPLCANTPVILLPVPARIKTRQEVQL